jgi:hypothetical protein
VAEADGGTPKGDDHHTAGGKPYRGQGPATQVGLLGRASRREVVGFTLFKGGWGIHLRAGIALVTTLGKVVDFHQRRGDVEDVSWFVHFGTPKIVRCQMYDRGGSIPHQCRTDLKAQALVKPHPWTY